jgi:hypothetical protein
MAIATFKKPTEIRDFGHMVNNFSDAGKGIATELSKAKVPQEDILRLVGRGRYNTLEAQRQGYVLRGPAAHKAARDNIDGLFGAFFYVHLPELRMAMQLPKLMGEAGCRFTILVDGEQYEAPLQQVKFGFTATPPCIIVSEDVMLKSVSGKEHTLAADTRVMRGREWVLEPKRSDNRTNFAKRQQFGIVDKDGRGIQQNACAYALWGQQGAKGMKALTQNSKEVNALQLTGTDDDFTAEGYLITTLESLAQHSIDLMPAFNRFVEGARDGLTARPELLRSMNEAVAVCDAVGQYAIGKRRSFGETPHHEVFRKQYLVAKEAGVWGDIERFVARRTAIHDTFAMLGLPVPQRDGVGPAQERITAQLTAHYDRALEQARRADGAEAIRIREAQRKLHEDDAQRERTRQVRAIKDDLRLLLMQDGNLFDVAAWRAGEGNRLRNPAVFPVYRQRFEHRLAATVPPHMSLGQLAGDVYQDIACRRIGHAATAMGDYLRGVSSMPWMRAAQRDRGDAPEAFVGTLNAAEQALRHLAREMDKPQERLKDLAGKANAIREAVALLDRMFGAGGVHPDTLNRKEIKPVHARRSFEVSQVHWQRTRRAPLVGLLNTLEAVEYDPVKWMALYRHCDAVMGVEKAGNTVPRTHAEGVLQRREQAAATQASLGA